jgi:hypothetical protein
MIVENVSSEGLNRGRFVIVNAVGRPELAGGMLILLAGVKLLIHLLLSGRYGYFRDELYFLACGRHLDWGYVDHAPMIGLMARLALRLGGSLHVLRAFPAVAGALLIVLTMLIAWRLGGGRFAQTLAGLAVLITPIYLAIDSIFTMNAFEPLFWMGCVYFLIRIIQTEESYFWIGFGVLAGLGLMNKHSTAFFGAAVVIGLLLTRQRKEFAKPWIWIAGGIALLIFLPNVLWQIHHNFPTLEDLRTVQASGKNLLLPPLKFIVQQILDTHPVVFPLWLAGLWSFLAGRNSKYRALGWTFLAFFLMMMGLHGKDYYVVPIYPMLFASGAVAAQSVLDRWRITQGARWPKRALVWVMVVAGVFLAPLVLPLLSPEHYLTYLHATRIPMGKREIYDTAPLPQIFSDQFGWPELVQQVAQIYHSLPPEQRAKTGILTGNYGEAGAIDLFGPQYGLPAAMSGHQTYYFWGTHGFTGDNLITVQYGEQGLKGMCNSVELAALHTNPWGMAHENHAIYLCRGLKRPLAEIWASQKHWN